MPSPAGPPPSSHGWRRLLPGRRIDGSVLIGLAEQNRAFAVRDGRLRIGVHPARWGRVLVVSDTCDIKLMMPFSLPLSYIRHIPSCVRFAFVCLSLVLLSGPLAPASAQPVIHVAEGVTLPDTARTVLAEILRDTDVASARVTSTYRSPEDQVRIMYGYIRRNGISSAKRLYGPEGDAVVEVYEQYRNRSREKALAAMLDELYRQLPSAFANKRLMHLHPCFYTVDVSMRSVPASRHEAFIRAAERHPMVHRFLGPGQGEREAFHIEVQRPGECAVESP